MILKISFLSTPPEHFRKSEVFWWFQEGLKKTVARNRLSRFCRYVAPNKSKFGLSARKKTELTKYLSLQFKLSTAKAVRLKTKLGPQP